MPIDPSQSAITASQGLPTSLTALSYRAEQAQTKDSNFGPDYILDGSLKPPSPPPPAGTVPFVPPPETNSAGQTLAALPPLEPLGAATLTELSLQNQMQAPTHAPFKDETP
jgi:hypothetical protein